ncbi:Unannotated [Lentimonas sp. CC19]|nr:Unannotated [Lentimonas sp. CC19]CAA6690661.1 Unannotated [Lentimonas sp. CC10]CAA7068915.1 Unannotated [Lentimonas sp. CC11]
MMDTIDYKLALSKRKPNCLVGIGAIAYGSYCLIMSAAAYPAIGAAFVVLGCIYIRMGLTAYRILSFDNKGIQLKNRSLLSTARWGKFSIDDVGNSFVVHLKNETFKFTKGSLPPEVLEDLKQRSEAKRSRKRKTNQS